MKRALSPILAIYALVLTCYKDHHGVRLASTIKKLRNVVDLLTEQRDSLQITCFYANTEQTPEPHLESQLSYLSDHAFEALDMARMFDVSVATIHKLLKNFNELRPFRSMTISFQAISFHPWDTSFHQIANSFQGIVTSFQV